MVFGGFGTYLRQFASLAILVAIAAMLVVLSCHGESLQFSTYPTFHPVSQSCEEEHTLQAGEVRTETSVFGKISIPGGKIFLAVAFGLTFFSLYPKSDERFTQVVKVMLVHNQRKRWIWARNLPFSSSGFFPYFAAVRDH